MSDPDYEQLEQHILKLSEEQQKRLIRRLREKVGLHPLEVTWNTDAETILNAIERGSDLTKRGIRGILAEASLGTHVIEQLEGWRDLEIKGDAPYDYLIEDGVGRVRIQVKNQRRERGKPKTGGNKYGHDMYMVETQKTRSGKSSEGKKTRPYRFGDFDILAVSLHPSKGDWTNFIFTVADWLIPDASDASCIQTFQPVSPNPNDLWTNELLQVIRWFRSDDKKVVWSATTSLS